MAIATLQYPFAEIHGSLRLYDKFYARQLNGKTVLQRKPATSSPAQQAMRQRFALRYAGNRQHS